MLRPLTIAALLSLAAASLAQSWSSAYEAGLRAARIQHWAEARQAFQQAAAYRPEDTSGPTILPGPPTERRQWRSGAPYSPNFLAAYAGWKEAPTLKPDQQAAMLKTVEKELETLVAKGQRNPLTLYILQDVYNRLGETEKRMTLQQKASDPHGQNWKVDTEVVDPQEIAILNQGANGAAVAQNPVVPSTNPQVAPTVTPTVTGPTQTGTPPTPAPVNPVLGGVPQLPNKFALIIGNSENRLPNGSVPYAADDAQRLREAIESYAGYLPSNVELVTNGTAQQIRATAQALAARVPQDGVVMIYFTGMGVNIGGNDYLAGVDTESPADTATMLAKSELYRFFMTRGAHIFAFYQVSRPVADGRFFGEEIPILGMISQAESTMPGDPIGYLIQNGKPIGSYTNAFIGELQDLRSNQLPIFEFGWQVFYRMRRGDTGTSGGSSQQTPTLPVLSNMAADARF